MIYDVFHFNDELDLLEIRFDLHDSFVDKYIIIECTKTYSGINKPLNFLNNKQRYSKYLHKVHHIILDYPFENNDNWKFEHLQRNIIKGFDFNDDDWILYSDCDEILKEWPRELTNGINHLVMDLCFYYLNLRVKSQKQVYHSYHLNPCFKNKWHMAKIVSGLYFYMFNNLYEIREYLSQNIGGSVIKDAGWHFSNLGDPERIYNKLKAISHANEPLFKDLTLDDVKVNQALNIDPLGRKGVEYECFELPEYFNKWDKYLWKT